MFGFHLFCDWYLCSKIYYLHQVCYAKLTCRHTVALPRILKVVVMSEKKIRDRSLHDINCFMSDPLIG